MFEELTSRFEAVFQKLRGRGKLSEENIAEAMREVRRALLEADVNFRVAKQFIERVQAKAVGAEVLQSITPGQQVVKIVADEMTSLLGGTAKPIRFHTNRQNCMVLAGLQGSGKTTACAKLALYFRKQAHRPLLVACDTHRPAAIDQLETLGRSLGIPVYAERGKLALEVCRGALDHARREGNTLVIVDTAGRLHIDVDMMAELKAICGLAKPEETYFVADAMTGQDAVNVAQEFHREIAFTGVILTKMDGDARGGAALSILDVTGVPVQFVGTSEKPDGLELFHPERVASRILGMGDIVSLVEKAQEAIDEQSAASLQKKMRRNEFSLQDFLDQLRQIKKMGSLSELLAMVPGMGASQLKDATVDQGALKRIEAAICSMTRQEREKPALIDGSRRRRIATGSGTTVQEVNRLLNQYDTMRTMLKRVNKMSGKRGRAAALRSVVPF
jgi:signal recognition particle subunit SRP54